MTPTGSLGVRERHRKRGKKEALGSEKGVKIASPGAIKVSSGTPKQTHR